jgi:Gpi18-like mannosyltransferase
LFSIPVVFNSSFWAQCDSIYVSFILLAVYFIHKDRNILSFVMLGISLAFKLQMIFILPIFLFYYVATRKVSIFHFLIIPAVDVLMCLPAILLGRNPMDIINIYVEQTDYGKLIQMNCPNSYALICSGTNIENYHLFKTFSIILTFVVLAVALVMIIYKNVNLKNKENFLLTAIWTVFTCIMFLSSMHERYTYLLDILIIIYALTGCKRYWLPVVCNLISLRGYCYYLFAYEVFDLKTAAIIFLAVYVYVTYIFVKDVIINGEKLPIVEITPPENVTEEVTV